MIQTADRDDLRKFLSSHNVRTSIHYPVLIPYQPAVQKRTHVVFGSLPTAKRQAQSILSLPIHQCLTDDEILHVIQTVRDFFTS